LIFSCAKLQSDFTSSGTLCRGWLYLPRVFSVRGWREDLVAAVACARTFRSVTPDGEQAKMIGSEPATAGHEKVPASRFTGLRGIAFRGYRWLLLGFLLLGVVQIFLAGLGVFSLQDQTLGGAGGDTAFAPHRAVGFTMAGVALLILGIAAYLYARSRQRGS
jgi:hypothetical protein